MAAPVEELVLIDCETNKDYKLLVSYEDAEKARRDINFATLLLQQAKKQDTSNAQATNKSSTSSSSNTDECIEGTHLWTKEETLLLLNIYEEYKDKFHNGKGTVKKYWERIADRMQQKGYNVTGIKCSTKLQALKRTYKSVVDHNKKSGNNPKKWEYLKIMQELFADKPWVQPLAEAGSHMTETETEEKENTLQEKRTKRRKLSTSIEEYILHTTEEQKKREQIRERQHEERLTAFKKIENLIKLQNFKYLYTILEL